MTTYAFEIRTPDERQAYRMQRELDSAGAVTSLVAYDGARDMYVFDSSLPYPPKAV